MIPRDYITSWRAKVPWVQDFQVEQDLVISRALVEIYSKRDLSAALAFRGGTALHKLHMKPPARYSEDIDLVQVQAGAISVEKIKEMRSPRDRKSAPRFKLRSWVPEKRKSTSLAPKTFLQWGNPFGELMAVTLQHWLLTEGLAWVRTNDEFHQNAEGHLSKLVHL